MSIDIFGLEIIALYLFLKEHEEEADPALFPLLSRLEDNLYNHLTIEELENLTQLYEKKIDLFKERGYF